MNWERFHYICRRALTEVSEQESLEDCITRIEKSPGCIHYGETRHSHSTPNKLLYEIKNAQDHDNAKKLLALYGKMELSALLAQPMQLKRVSLYLGYVTFIFFVISGVYQVQVTPTFLEAFESFEMPTPEYLVFYRDYWKYFALIIFGLLGFSLYLGQFLTKILEFQTVYTNSSVLRFFTLPKIENSYEKILQALFYPISPQYFRFKNSDTTISEHLREIEQAGMDLHQEISSIIKIERNNLLASSEKQMRIISAIIALVIIASIFHFMASAYSPIFVLGETI